MYLFAFFCMFIIVLFIVPSYLTYKKTGIKPIKFTNSDTAINYVGKAYKIISLVAFATVFINAFAPGANIYLIPVTYLQHQPIKWVGYVLVHLSFIWIFIAQRNMANEWRIGIDNKNKVNLITKGLFKISRNPIFLGVATVFAGLFFIIPNAVTILILFTGIIVIQVQVRLEEEFLLKELGNEYRTYMHKTNRWLL